jgi:hypothetical protein
MNSADQMPEFNPVKQIQESTDLAFLSQLEKFIDMDIKRLPEQNEIIREHLVQIHGPDYVEKQTAGLVGLKKLVQQHIEELS